MALKTQGTQLYIADPTGTNDCELIKVECATALSGFSNPREQIETTCLESDAREYVGGLATPGQVTVTVNFDPANESHMRLYELWKNNVDFKAAVGMGQPVDSDPSLDSGCEFVFPTNRSFIEFDGYVVDVPLEAALNSVWTAGIPIQMSGAYTLYEKTT